MPDITPWLKWRGIFPISLLSLKNVDGLHCMAGSSPVIELHGNIQRVRCSECGEFAEDWNDDGVNVPRLFLLRRNAQAACGLVWRAFAAS